MIRPKFMRLWDADPAVMNRAQLFSDIGLTVRNVS